MFWKNNLWVRIGHVFQFQTKCSFIFYNFDNYSQNFHQLTLNLVWDDCQQCYIIIIKMKKKKTFTHITLICKVNGLRGPIIDYIKIRCESQNSRWITIKGGSNLKTHLKLVIVKVWSYILWNAWLIFLFSCLFIFTMFGVLVFLLSCVWEALPPTLLWKIGWVGLFLFTNLYPCPSRGTHTGYLGINSPL